jgi:Ca-activated chloride channel homolog
MSARRLLTLLSLLLALLVGAGCAPADASKARSRSVIENGGIVQAEELRVAEYLSYYKQPFPEPAGRTVGLNLRLGNPRQPASGGEAWLQIGLQARSTQTDLVAPLNLALVIDRSGSMNSPEKMPYLKRSLSVFLKNLGPEDMVAIVAYSDTAQVVLPSRTLGDGTWIQATIERLQPGGSTNLYAGLMAGFREVERNLDIRRNNRVILLTDGIANVGVIDPARIAADALAYNNRGIYLSTIGLGQDFNDALLSQLARQGKGAYHFVDSAEEMDKVFRDESAGLVQKAAADVSIIVTPADGVQLQSITGYEGTPPSGPVQIKMRDMGTGDSQVVLVKLTVAAGSRNAPCSLAQVELRYQDLFAQRQESATLCLPAEASLTGPYDPLADTQVLRNVTIQRTAEGIKEIDRLYRAQSYQAAWDVAHRLEQDLRHVADLTGEEQMTRDADLMQEYQTTLAKWAGPQARRSPTPVGDSGSRQGNWPRATATPAVVEIK